MNILLLVTLFILPFLESCSKPKATVFEDNRLAQEETIKLCLLGDLGRDTLQQKEMAKALQREECHRIFFLGDLVYPSGINSMNDPELQDKFLSYYLPLTESNPDLVIPLVLGNHDHKGDPSVWKDVSKEYPQFFFPNYYYMIDYGGLCIVAVDTSFYYYTEKVAEAAEQAAWMIQMNSRIKDCDVKVAISHHPLKGDGYAGSKDWEGASGPLKAFLETYIIGKMDLHVAGHVHILEDDGKDEGTRLLISGTGGEILGGGKPGFVVLTWQAMNPKAVGYSFRRIDTDVNVYEDMMQSQEEMRFEELEPEDKIEKGRVEDPLWSRILNSLFG